MDALLVDVVVVAALVGVLLAASRLLGPASVFSGDKALPYETGMPPLAAPGQALWSSYWRYAVLFVVFDADLAFLAPWILLRDGADRAMVWTLTLFLGVIGFTLAYLWKKGALEC